jgi:hypothetical protein
LTTRSRCCGATARGSYEPRRDERSAATHKLRLELEQERELELEREREREQELEQERELELEQEREREQELEQERELEQEQELRKGSLMAKLVSPLSVGRSVFIRTVTMYYTGRVVSVKAGEVVLTEAAWIADAGRWHNALKNGTLSEVEPFVDPVSINRGSIIDVTEWKHALPKEQK